MKSIVAITIVTGLAVPVGVASNVINEHSGYYEEGVHYTILTSGGNDYAVLINEGSDSDHIWKFEAYDSETDDPGYIDYIRIDPTDTVGHIKLSIVGAPGHTYGADDVKEIDLLTNADDTTEIVDITILGDLATDGDVSCDNITGNIDVGGNITTGGDVICDSITGDIDVDGTLDECGLPVHKLQANSVTGDIDLGGLWGDIDVGSLANLTVGDTPGGRTPGNITVGQAYGATLTINDGYTGTITIEGDLTGTIDINGIVLGQVVIEGDVDASADGGVIDLSSQLNNSDEPGIHVLGSLTGSDATIPLIYVDGQLTGVIAVNGGLADAKSSAPSPFRSPTATDSGWL
jgi:hypothetical protein